MRTSRPALRERKKQATRTALREAALRLALERGPGNVRVDDIAQAAGVSPRTYNNYFSSREQAIVAAVTAQREARVAATVAARPASEGLALAVVEGVVEQYADPGMEASFRHARDLVGMIGARGALRDAFLGTTEEIEKPLAAVIAQRLGDADRGVARILAASVAAAVRVALERWLAATPASTAAAGLVVVSGSLPDLLRAALAPLMPALDAAESQRRARGEATEPHG